MDSNQPINTEAKANTVVIDKNLFMVMNVALFSFIMKKTEQDDGKEVLPLPRIISMPRKDFMGWGQLMLDHKLYIAVSHDDENIYLSVLSANESGEDEQD